MSSEVVPNRANDANRRAYPAFQPSYAIPTPPAAKHRAEPSYSGSPLPESAQNLTARHRGVYHEQYKHDGFEAGAL